ncbi:MAG TPA: hypothetical protein DCS35_01275 [Vibrio sp.]|nr:hypothetical protein [Vibrio sp.]
MLDMHGILSEYLPLQLIHFGDVYADKDGDPMAWLDEYDFEWQPIVDTKYTPQLYFGDEVMHFAPKDRNKKASLQKRLGGQPLRMPKVSECWGDQSLLIANELANELQFASNLGVTRSEAVVFDAAGNEHLGYTAFSFHKSFFHERVEVRFATMPQELRPLIRISLTGYSSTYLIHKSIFEKWQSLAVEDLNYDIDADDLVLDNLIKSKFYSGHVGSRCFFSMDDFQQNQNGHID